MLARQKKRNPTNDPPRRTQTNKPFKCCLLDHLLHVRGHLLEGFTRMFSQNESMAYPSLAVTALCLRKWILSQSGQGVILFMIMDTKSR